MTVSWTKWLLPSKRWLDHPKNARWLMVFDNYDNPKVPGNVDHTAVDIRQFLPEATTAQFWSRQDRRE
jgi:hypothetical protein